jgi:serine acetyltransferase
VFPGQPVRVAPVVIGRNAWLGRNVVVLPGVAIGAIVTSNVAANTLVGGNPARLIRDSRSRIPSITFAPEQSYVVIMESGMGNGESWPQRKRRNGPRT